MESSTVLLVTVAGGILPALFWLWYWLREDRKCPEPTWRLVTTFIAGMIAALVALELELIYNEAFAVSITITLFAYAAIEEIVKYAASYISALRTRAFDEPIDAPIYMITAALGFAALENSFFLYSALTGPEGGMLPGLEIGNVRFIGATLLHVLASATVGIALALSYYRSMVVRIICTSIGLGIAIILHTAFNYLIIGSTTGAEIFATLGLVWFAIIILLLFFEKIKAVTKKHHATT